MIGSEKFGTLQGETDYADWAFKLVGFLTEAYPALKDIFQTIDAGERNPDGTIKKDETKIDDSYVDDLVHDDNFTEAPVVSRELYHLLIQIVGGKGTPIMKSVPVGNGLEAWRRFSRDFWQQGRDVRAIAPGQNHAVAEVRQHQSGAHVTGTL